MDPNLGASTARTSNTTGDGSNPSGHPASSRSRKPSVVNACERCRKRKIRCDERTPCATCARFHVACVRPNHRLLAKDAQSALEERVRLLEEQLARVGAQNVPNAQSNTGSSAESSPTRAEAGQGAQELRIDTEFDIDSPSGPYPYPFDCSTNFEVTSGPYLPAIEITQFDTPNYLDVSPSPSLVFSSSRGSTPDTSLVSSLVSSRPDRRSSLTVTSSYSIGPSAIQYPSEPLSNLNPFASVNRGRSSSLSEEIWTPNTPFSLDPSDQQALAQSKDASGPSSQRPSSLLAALPQQHQIPQPSPFQHFPSKTEAEILTMSYLSHFGQQHSTSRRQILSICLNAVYNILDPASPELSSAVSPSINVPSTEYSFGMAQFHVFMVLACGLRLLNADSSTKISDSHENMLATCYHHAMQHVHSIGFWDEPGGVEAATYLLNYVKSSPSA